MTRSSAGRRGSALLVLMLAAVVLVVIGTGAAWLYWGTRDGQRSGPLTEQVTRAAFVHDIVEAGAVESSENVEVRCEVKARNGAGTSIIRVVPEGTLVQQGEEIVLMDSSLLEQELLQEQIILNNKKAAMEQADNLRAAAEQAVKEYLGDPQAQDEGARKGTFHVEEDLIKAEIFVAEENLRRAQQYAAYSERLAAKGYVTSLQLESDRFAVEKAQKDVDSAQTKLHVLRNYTRKKMERQLQSDLNIANATYQAEKSSHELEQKRVKEITDQIAKCTITAPQAGQVVYANEVNHRGGMEFVIEPGAVIRERQVMVRLPNSSRMQVKAKISESKIALVKEGMPAKITIDAFDDLALTGVVTKVNEYPEPAGWFSSSVKEYITHVRIDNPPANLKSGLTAKVRIHAQHIPDSLQVPIQAVHRHKGRYYCLVRDGNSWRPQPVTLGASNEKHVVIADGLKTEDHVAMNPAALIDRVTLPDLPEAGGEQIAAHNAARPQANLVASGAPEAKDAAAGPRRERNGSRGSRNPGQMVSGIISANDRNSDGKLAEDEMPEQFRANFSAADANSDGQIDAAELTAAMAKRLQQREPAGAGE